MPKILKNKMKSNENTLEWTIRGYHTASQDAWDLLLHCNDGQGPIPNWRDVVNRSQDIDDLAQSNEQFYQRDKVHYWLTLPFSTLTIIAAHHGPRRWRQRLTLCAVCLTPGRDPEVCLRVVCTTSGQGLENLLLRSPGHRQVPSKLTCSTAPHRSIHQVTSSLRMPEEL